MERDLRRGISDSVWEVPADPSALNLACVALCRSFWIFGEGVRKRRV